MSMWVSMIKVCSAAALVSTASVEAVSLQAAAKTLSETSAAMRGKVRVSIEAGVL
jgi:hypothetical protein